MTAQQRGAPAPDSPTVAPARRSRQIPPLPRTQQEICRTRDLEALIRQANAMAGCRSFDDMVNAFRAMRSLG
jgi:hypothetical protein